MGSDILVALSLVLIIEGLLPGIAPSAWLKVMTNAAKMGPQGIRVAGIVCMLSGALLLFIIT